MLQREISFFSLSRLGINNEKECKKEKERLRCCFKKYVFYVKSLFFVVC